MWTWPDLDEGGAIWFHDMLRISLNRSYTYTLSIGPPQNVFVILNPCLAAE